MVTVCCCKKESNLSGPVFNKALLATIYRAAYILMMHPLVSVILPCYNAEAYIAASVQSILNQTHTNIELIVIDDASTDQTVPVIRNIADNRLQLIEKPANTGYTDSLNMGLSLARGTYIARMDADDISEPTRLAKQVAYFETHPEVVLCGCWITLIPQQTVFTYPVEHFSIVEELFSRNSFAHPSVMFRKSIVDQHTLRYDRTFEPTEDYELWTRMMMLGEVYNIPEPLLEYRTHGQQISNYKSTLQKQNRMRTRLQLLQKLTEKPLPDELLEEHFDNTEPAIKRLEALSHKLSTFNELLAANISMRIYPAQAFTNYVQTMHQNMCRSFSSRKYRSSFAVWIKLCLQSPSFFYHIGLRNSLSFTLRCIGNLFSISA
jgi:glycosyltransferase involved in cell wall biosynthesis